MGSFPAPGPFVSRYAQVLVLCAKELQPHKAAYPGVRVIYAPMNDDGSPMSAEEPKIAVMAAKKVRRALDLGQTCLVTCHLGRNRSGLISALALMMPLGAGLRMWVKSDTPSCLTSDQATYMVRRARGPHALANLYFQQMLAASDGMCDAAFRSFLPGAFLP